MRRFKGVFLLGPMIVGASAVSAQTWGRPEHPRSGACFYEHPDFRGRYFCASAGDSMRMVPEGMNDRISSIRVFGDAEVTVFKDRDFRGDSRAFGRDMGDLRAVGFNDRISSFRVGERRRWELSWGQPEEPRSGACFYEHPEFRGRYFCAGVGDSIPMVPEGMNDRISSIRMFGDAEVTAYKDRDFRGDSRGFGRDMADLRAVGFNDRISSFRVDPRGFRYRR